MPYIEQEFRPRFDVHIEKIAEEIDSIVSKEKNRTAFAGLLKYIYANLILEVIPERRYWAICMVGGVFSNMGHEFFRKFQVTRSHCIGRLELIGDKEISNYESDLVTDLKEHPGLNKHIKNLAEEINLMVQEKSDKKLFTGLFNYCGTTLALRVVPCHCFWVLELFSKVLEEVNFEFYQIYAVPYEDEKIEENGDVY